MRPRCFIDFDRTLFDTEYANAFFLEDAARLAGSDAVDRVYAMLKASTFSLDRFVALLHLPDIKAAEYTQSVLQRGRLYQHAADTLNTLSNTHDLILISYGDDGYQKLKLSSVIHLLPSFKTVHIMQDGITKGDIVATYGKHAEDLFIDDLPKHLLDVRTQAPWVALFRPMHPTSHTAIPHDSDNLYWTTFDDFRTLII